MDGNSSKTIVVAVVGTLMGAGLILLGKTIGTNFSESQYKTAVKELALDDSEGGFISKVAGKVEIPEPEKLDINAVVNALLESQSRNTLLDILKEDGRFAGLAGLDGSSGLSLPIGSVIAWPGTTEAALAHSENWQVCDGREVKYNSDLWSVLKGMYDNRNVNTDERDIVLPDFQGRFLRGSDGLSNPIGVPQKYATAMPRNAFKTAFDGQHQHDGGTDSGSKGLISTSANTATSSSAVAGSKHKHSIVGGDEETRPDNYAVVWLIRVK